MILGLARLGWTAAVGCLLVSIMAGCGERSVPAEPFIATDLTGAKYGSGFALTDHHGKLRSLPDFKGKAVLLFFGYTHCPDVCVTILSDLRMLKQQLGRDGARIQVLFITLDPQRDTREKLASYMAYFDPEFLALSGDEATTASIAREFKVHYSRHDMGSAAGYFIDHSAGIYGFDTQGRLRLLFNYGTELSTMIHDIKLLLGNKP